LNNIQKYKQSFINQISCNEQSPKQMLFVCRIFQFSERADEESDRAPLIKATRTSARREEMRRKWGIGDDERV
jgi:hypothetical protein